MASSRIDYRPAYRRGCLLLLLFASVAGSALAQQPAEKPLPDLSALLIQTGVNARKAEAIRRDYIYRFDSRFEELNGNGSVKKIDTTQQEAFWLNGVPVFRLLSKDGKPLSADEEKKESERIDKEVAKARARRTAAEDKGKETNARGDEMIPFSRFAELGTFSNERRVVVNRRSTIAIDYLGDPKAKTHNVAEGAIRNLEGTVWVDEEDEQIQHVEARFNTSFKIAAGLVANVSQGTAFTATFTKVNGEVWLPQTIDGHGHARFLLLINLNGNSHVSFYDYRKFKANATILPGVSVVPSESETSSPTTTAQPATPPR